MSANPESQVYGQLQRWRIAAIVSLLAIELAIWALLRSKGWLGTLDTLGWLAALAMFTLPCAMAAALLGFRGRRFSLRSMMIVTGLAALFLAFFLLPYIRARGSRTATQALKSKRVRVYTESSLGLYYESLGLPDDGTDTESRGTPAWISPLLNGLPTTHADEILELDIWFDEQVPTILALQDDLPNLRNIRIFGLKGKMTCATAAGLESLSRGLSPIEALAIINVSIPENCCQRFAEIRYLTIHARDGSSPVYDLTESQLRDIAATPGLEFLKIYQCKLDDGGAAILAESPRLRHMDLWRTQVTETARDEIQDNHPRLTVRLHQ